MNKSRIILCLLFLLVLSGCANMSEERKTCIWLSSFTGLGAGGAVGGLPGAGGGIAGGALLGTIFCDDGTSPPPQPVAEETGNFWADDQDRDGVRDQDDACPFTPEGVAVDSKGCAHDNDGDGVPDYRDDCPETPLGSVVDTSGCARAVISLKDVHFAFDSASLTSEARTVINRAVPAIRASSNNIIIAGHTDSTGSDSYNLGLSKRRAQSVRDYLVSQGVSASRLTVVGKGESDPIASNDTREGRAQNRRVEAYTR